jgi:hypothetical protein
VKRGAVIAGVAAVVVAGAVAAVLAGGGGGKGDVAAGSEPSTDKTRPDTAEPVTTAPEVAKPDALCVAHETRTAAVTALGTVDTPADREAAVLAQLTFYSDAAELEPEPDATAFRMLAQYFDALRVFHDARNWENTDLADIAELPRPPTGDWATRTSELLAERCGVPIPTDMPVEGTP